MLWPDINVMLFEELIPLLFMDSYGRFKIKNFFEAGHRPKVVLVGSIIKGSNLI